MAAKEEKDKKVAEHEKKVAANDEKAKKDALDAADKAAADAVSGEGDPLPKNEAKNAAEKADDATAADPNVSKPAEKKAAEPETKEGAAAEAAKDAAPAEVKK